MAKFNFKSKTIIYILCPSNIDTGGPTDLHQLANLLKKKFKKKVFMYYYPNFIKKPVHKNYKNYKIPFCKKIIDEKKNILIIPETYHLIKLSKNYKDIQKGLWWLSIDNFLKHWFSNNNNFLSKQIIKLPYRLINLVNKMSVFRFENISFFRYLKFIYINLSSKNIFKIDDINVNFSHSDYQFNILKAKGINSIKMSDYIRKKYFLARKKILIKNKKDIICYNPSKSSAFFKKFIEKNKDLNFLPLKNFTLDEVIYHLSKSKIYIDFGFHPGQDHLPREAAVLKNCIITNREGSAGLFNDVPINNEFKFTEINSNFINLRNKIDIIFNNFPKELKKFSFYNRYLFNQKKVFSKQISKIFF